MNINRFFQAMTLSRLSVRLTNATLEIYADDIEDVHVMVSGGTEEVEALRINLSGDALVLEQPVTATAKAAAVATSWMQVAVRIPRSWKGRIEARTVTGWMNLRGLNGSDLALDTVSGLISATDLNFISAAFRAVIGDVKLNHVHLEKCTMASTSGDLTAVAAALGSVTASTVTGQIALGLVEPFAEITMNTVTGDLCLDVPMEECDAVLRSVSGRIHTSGVFIQEGAPKLRATTVSSDLDITRCEAAH